MGTIADFFFGKTVAAPDDNVAQFHDSSVLADIILATQLQQGSSSNSTMQVAAVYRSVQIITDLAASMPWFAFDGGKHSGSRQVALPERRDELPTVLVQPDPLTSRDQWVRDAAMSLAFRGNAYLLGDLYVEGHPTIVRVLNPDSVTVSWSNEARTSREYSWGSTKLPSSQVRHIRLNQVPGALQGVGPIQAMSRTIAGQIAADTWARDLFTNSGTPSGKLMHPGKLDVDEANELGMQWDSAHLGTRRTAVLSGGLDFEPVSLTPDQAQFLQSRSFGVSEIARAFGIPAPLLNAATGVAGASGGSLTYQNVQQVWIELLQLTVRPVYLERIAAAMSSYLPRGTSVQFDMSEFMRPDEMTRFNSAAVALTNGFLTVDEVRAREGLAPSPELNNREVTNESADA